MFCLLSVYLIIGKYVTSIFSTLLSANILTLEDLACMFM